MIRSNRRRPLVTLAAALLALAAFLAAADRYLSLDEPVNTRSALATPPKGDIPAALTNPVTAIDPAQLAIVVGRPLFSETRRPPLPPPPAAAVPVQASAAPQPVAPVLDFALVGIALVSDERVVLVQGPGGEPARQLRRGETYRGWVLTAIGEDRAMFRNAGESKELVLDFTHGAPAL